jgi:hypothetical protein
VRRNYFIRCLLLTITDDVGSDRMGGIHSQQLRNMNVFDSKWLNMHFLLFYSVLLHTFLILLDLPYLVAFFHHLHAL